MIECLKIIKKYIFSWSHFFGLVISKKIFITIKNGMVIHFLKYFLSIKNTFGWYPGSKRDIIKILIKIFSR